MMAPRPLELRSAGTNAAAAEQFRKIFEDRILTFVGSIAGDRPDTRRRAAMLSSQVLGMCYCRCILQLPAVVELDPETIVASLARVLQHYLTGDLARLAAPLRTPATLQRLTARSTTAFQCPARRWSHGAPNQVTSAARSDSRSA